VASAPYCRKIPVFGSTPSLFTLGYPLPMLRDGALQLKDYPKPMVRLICSRCSRKGQYRKTTLIEAYGEDVALPNLLHLIAKCERHGKIGTACGVRYGDLLPRRGG
jgi:hypothetical protein